MSALENTEQHSIHNAAEREKKWGRVENISNRYLTFVSGQSSTLINAPRGL